MKKLLLVLAASIALASTAAIRWEHQAQPLMKIMVNETNWVQLGLRDDGVVVWKEIGMGPITNSPAERASIAVPILPP